ncbi:MAG: hypothetical protein HFJ29_07340 [Clostridia bacterium]|nr:hypothetical protein [Clostridia bacterium]
MEEENKKAEEAKEQEKVTEEKTEKKETVKEEKPKKKNKKNVKKEVKQEPKEDVEKAKNENAEQIIQEAKELIEEQKEIIIEEKKEEIPEKKEESKERKKEMQEPEKKEGCPVEESKSEIEKESQQFAPVEKQPKNKKKGIIITFSVVIALIIISIFSIIFALMNINNKNILKGISILGIDVSDLTIEEAKKRINDAIDQKFSNEKDSLVLKRGELEVSVNANTFNAKFDVDTAVAEAYNIGRGGNIVTNNYAILWHKFFPKEVEAKLHWDEEFMQTTISDTNSKMKDAVVEYSYYIEDKKLIVVKGKEGYVIKKEELQNQIIEQLENIHNPYQEIEIPVEKRKPNPINIEKIRNEIYKEPKDAYVERNPTKVHVEEDGIDFGISLEEAKKLIQEDREEYEIPLKITQAKKKLSDLGEEAFSEQIATFSTIYDASARNRAHNVELATKKINGIIIRPGETFSYNKTVGSRTIEAGWKEGTAYIAGKVVPSVGGGVCQVSSTLYNTALLANLEITERTNHTFTVDYVAASRDATVYYGSLDFCFKNTRTYPIKIVATAQNGVCKISIYGIKEEVEYEVIIQSKITSYINNTTVYKEDPTLAEGKEVVEQIGFNGCRSEGYKILKHNGKIISQTLLSKDTYSPQERIVRKGTKK